MFINACMLSWSTLCNSLAPLSMEFPRQEYWSELSPPTPRDPNPGIKSLLYLQVFLYMCVYIYV